jgi:O-antigen/teichoic acid export membrane protein
VIQRALPTSLGALGSDGAYLLAGRLLQLANGFATTVVIVRMFGLAGAGSFTLAMAAVIPLTQLCALGLPSSLPRSALGPAARNTVGLTATLLCLPPAACLILAFGLAFALDPAEALVVMAFASAGYFLAQANVATTLLLLAGRTRWALLAPVCGSFGIGLGALLADDLLSLALWMAMFRILGNFGLFAALPGYGLIGRGQWWQEVRAGAVFLPMDTLMLLAEQLALVVLSVLLSRDELGLYGLCRQMLNAADTPGWSFVQAHYPNLVQTRLASAQALGRSLIRLTLVVAIAALAGAGVLAEFVYREPVLFEMMAVILTALPARGFAHFADRVLRAVGRIRLSTQLAAGQLALALAVFPLAALGHGIWGAVVALALLSVVWAVIYDRFARPLLTAPTPDGGVAQPVPPS